MPNVHLEAAGQTQGVCSWSQPFIWQEFVLFCCGNDPIKEGAFTTYANANLLWFKSMIGSYKGKTERSFMMTLADFEAFNIAAMFCKQEESILVLGCPKSSDMALPATLVFLDGSPSVDLGLFVETGETGAKKEEGWTYDPTTKKFYVCQPHQVRRKSPDVHWSKPVVIN